MNKLEGLEWSYAVNTNVERELLSNKYLVFMECKVVVAQS